MTEQTIDDTIGSSDVPGILGLSPWQTPSQVWARKRGLVADSGGSNATRRGHLFELALLWDYAEQHGLDFDPRRRASLDELMREESRERPQLVRGVEYGLESRSDVHEDYPWARCRPDAYVLHVEDLGPLVEAKTTRSFADWQDAEGRLILPPAYFVQVQWQMLVTGATETHVEAFCVMDDSRRSIVVPGSRKIQQQLLAKVGEWRERYLLGDELPENMPAEIAGLVWPAPREPEEWLAPTEEDRSDVAVYLAANATIAAAEAEKKAARDRLCRRIADATGIEGLCSWRATKRGRTFRALKEE